MYLNIALPHSCNRLRSEFIQLQLKNLLVSFAFIWDNHTNQRATGLLENIMTRCISTKILVLESFIVILKQVTFCWMRIWTPKFQILGWQESLVWIKHKAIQVELLGLSEYSFHFVANVYKLNAFKTSLNFMGLLDFHILENPRRSPLEDLLLFYA